MRSSIIAQVCESLADPGEIINICPYDHGLLQMDWVDDDKTVPSVGIFFSRPGLQV